MTVAFRTARPGDRDDRTFVVSSWLDAFRDAHDAGMISMDRWYDVMWTEVERLLDRRGTRTILACNADDETQLHGFICGDPDADPPLIHFVYTKAAYRCWKPKPGIARRLFAAIGIDPQQPFDYTYRTAIVSRLQRKIPFAQHQRMLARFPDGQGRRR